MTKMKNQIHKIAVTENQAIECFGKDSHFKAPEVLRTSTYVGFVLNGQNFCPMADSPYGCFVFDFDGIQQNLSFVNLDT